VRRLTQADLAPLAEGRSMKPKVEVQCPNCKKTKKVRPNGYRWVHCSCGTSYEVRDGKVTGEYKEEK